ncbi:uncharacterized protein LOC132729986 [Ruditapes philippinarum]|uniref:uncharacterized protein LOC132729986 n=1 Tax=Ruditapes philippinarum TaxID=129788 RepID=UPI00295C1A82|nr:uncharacterized protein LOC132729986 [Ruditapes philippinarum]
MKIDKLRSVREGQRRCVEIQLERIGRGKENSSMIEFNAILEAIVRKAETIKSLNEKILELTEVIDIEEEVVNSEEYGLTLEIKMRELRAYSENRKSNTEEQQNAYSEPTNPQNQNKDGSGSLTENNNLNNGNSSLQNVSTFQSNTSLYQRLPKLSLPVFSGDILEWQSFWDAFDSSVHQNPNLTEVQKFNYLKTQLEGNAAQVIQGFALTHANYIQAVDLLKERFGQSHKIIHAYIQALLNLPAPSNTLHSMRNYYDKLEAYIRGLESLGQCQNTYGTLLVPVIIDKLPAEIRKSLARENGNDEWLLETLRKALYRELNIMETGQTTDDLTGYRSTASFFTDARQKTGTGSHVTQNSARETFDDQEQCIFCNEFHNAKYCTKVTDVRARKDVIRNKHLCFNCLNNQHQVINCPSNYRCFKCRRKHHTSICESSPDPNLNTGASESTQSSTEYQPTNQAQTATLQSSTAHEAFIEYDT